METRSLVLQYDLSGRHAAGFPEQIRAVQNQDRQEQLQRLRRMRFEMQSVVHRPQDAHGRLQPLHSLFRLPGQLPAAGDPVLVHRIESGGSVGRLRNLPLAARPKRQAFPNRPTGRGGSSSARCWRPPPCCPKHSPGNRKSCYRAAKGTNGSIRSAPRERSARSTCSNTARPATYVSPNARRTY